MILDDENILIKDFEKNKYSLISLFNIKDEDFTHYQDFIKSIINPICKDLYQMYVITIRYNRIEIEGSVLIGGMSGSGSMIISNNYDNTFRFSIHGINQHFALVYLKKLFDNLNIKYEEIYSWTNNSYPYCIEIFL